MAFRKRYTKRVYKGSRTLKKRNIFKNTSSKSQAKQIYKLNKKVNYIQKTTAPEIQQLQDNLRVVSFTDGNSRPILHYNDSMTLYKDFLLNNQRTRYIDMCGDMLRVRYLYLYGLFGVYADTSLEGDWASQPLIREHTKQPFTAYLRLIVCKLKKSVQSVPLKITQDPDELIATGSNYWGIKPINGPLITNLGSQLTVLKDKVIKVNNTNPMKLFKIKLSPKQLGYTYRKPPTGSAGATVGENEIVIYYEYVCPNVLQHVDTGGNKINVGPNARFTLNVNYGYIDQN